MLPCTGFLSSVGLQTKRRCFFCLCLSIIRGAQLSSAPLLTLFSEHYWSVLSRLYRHNCHVHVQIHYPVIRKPSLDLIPEMKERKKQSDSQVSRKQNGFQFSWLLSSRVWKGTLLHITMLLLFRVSQLCQVAEFCLVRKETTLNWYCSAFRQLLAELMRCRFRSANWNSSRTSRVFCLSINMFVFYSKARFCKICWPTVCQFCCVELSCALFGWCKSKIWLDSQNWIKPTVFFKKHT